MTSSSSSNSLYEFLVGVGRQLDALLNQDGQDLPSNDFSQYSAKQAQRQDTGPTYHYREDAPARLIPDQTAAAVGAAAVEYYQPPPPPPPDCAYCSWLASNSPSWSYYPTSGGQQQQQSSSSSSSYYDANRGCYYYYYHYRHGRPAGDL